MKTYELGVGEIFITRIVYMHQHGVLISRYGEGSGIEEPVLIAVPTEQQADMIFDALALYDKPIPEGIVTLMGVDEHIRLASEKQREMTGFFAGLTDEQKKKALEYQGDDHTGDPAFSRDPDGQESGTKG